MIWRSRGCVFVAIEARRAALGCAKRAPAAEPGFHQFFLLAYEQTLGLVTVALGDRGLAEDAAQEAFARAFDRWNAVSRMSHPDRWVAKVAMNLAIDQLRRTTRETALDPSIEAPVRDDVEALWVRWNLERLTPMQRATVVRRYLEGMPVQEVARSLGRSPQTVKTHLRLARGRLRQFMREDRP
jgi:RNA polymerase sigma factor (sigma-70 family)